MSEWKTVSLEELAAAEKSAISKPYGSAIMKDDYVTKGIPVVRGVNLAKGRFHDDDFVFISTELADKMPGSRLQPGDLVFTHRGSVGQVSMIPRAPSYPRYVVSTSQVKARLDERIAVPEFYYYWFRSPEGQHSILQCASTVGVPGIGQPVASIKSLQVPLPPLKVQQCIATTLGSLDEKIESNHRSVNLATRLIDCLAKEMIDLNESTSTPLRELVYFNRVTHRPGDANSEILYIDIASVSQGRIDAVLSTTWGEAPSRARRGVAEGDVIYSTVRPARRSFALVLEPDERTVVSTGFAVMSPSKSIGSSLLATVAGSPEFAAYLDSVAHGSAYPAVSVEAMGNYPVDVPADPEVAAQFEYMTMPLRRKAHQIESENAKLVRLRDTLLPELLSGRIRVPESKNDAA